MINLLLLLIMQVTVDLSKYDDKTVDTLVYNYSLNNQVLYVESYIFKNNFENE